MLFTHWIEIRVASSLLLFRIPVIALSLKALRRWASWALFYYVLGLPLFKAIPPIESHSQNHRFYAFIAVAFCDVFNNIRGTEISAKNSRKLLDGAVPPLLWFAVVRITHHAGSAVESFYPIRLLVAIGTTWVGFIAIALWSLALSAFPAEAAAKWLRFRNVVLVVVTFMRVLLMTPAAIEALEVAREHFGMALIASKPIALTLVMSGLTKFAFGSESTPWLNGRYFVLFSVPQLLGLPQLFSNLIRGIRSPRSDSSEAYVYRPLIASGRIRLLLLHPRHPNDPVACTMFETTLDRAPRFEAMSYTWGSPNKEYQIVVDRKQVGVTSSAYHLLQDLSSIFLSQLVWIDSICINQDDVEEKSQQVALMADIYTRASLVTVHLNSNTTDVENVLKDTGRLFAKMKLQDMHTNIAGAARHNDSADICKLLLSSEAIQAFLIIQELRQGGLDGLSTSESNNPITYEGNTWKCNALARLLRQPWFERIWVVQEVVLASSARILYHGQEMDWEDFAEGIDEITRKLGRMNRLEMTDNPKLRSTVIIAKATCLNSIIKWRHGHKPPARERISFAEMMQCSSYFKATDLRDHVFGVQGLCPQSVENWTKPDYTLSVENVYLNAANRLIHDSDMPLVMSLAGIGYSDRTTDSLQHLPSWVPDWSGTTRWSSREGQKPFAIYGEYLGQNTDTAYASGGLSEWPVHIGKRKGASIFLPAITVGVVAGLGPTLDIPLDSTGQYNTAHFGKLLDTWLQTHRLIMDSQFTEDPYPHTPRGSSGSGNKLQPLEEVLWRVLIGDRTRHERPAPETLAKGYLMWIRTLRSSLGGVDFFGRYIKGLSQKKVERMRELHRFLSSMMEAWPKRRVGFTSSGHIGLFPGFCAVGNVVMVVPQAQTPFVFEKLPVDQNGVGGKEEFKLVGECYVHGIMDGERLRSRDEEDLIEVV